MRRLWWVFALLMALGGIFLATEWTGDDRSSTLLKETSVEDSLKLVEASQNDKKPNEKIEQTREGLGISGEGYSYESQEHIGEMNDEPHEAVAYMIGAAMKEDVNLFSQAFDPNTFNETVLQLQGEPNPMDGIVTYMNEITKNQTVANIEVKKEEVSVKNGEPTYSLHLSYENDETEELRLIIGELIDDKHDDHKHGISVIETLPHELVEQLNK